MQFHVVIDGEKRGPYAAYRVIDLLRGKEVSPDALAWEPGMESWLPLRKIPAFAEVIEVIENPPEPAIEEKTSPSPEVNPLPNPRGSKLPTEASEKMGAGALRPFSRFWARTFDYMLVSLVAAFFVEVPDSPFSPDEPIRFDQMKEFISDPAYQNLIRVQYFALFLWHALEGLLISRFGATPGKALFGISISDRENHRLPVSRGMSRAFLVWATGFGLGLFPFNLIGMGIGLFMLLTTGATFWDRQLAIVIRHTSVGPARILMAVGGFLLLMILSSLKFS